MIALLIGLYFVTLLLSSDDGDGAGCLSTIFFIACIYGAIHLAYYILGDKMFSWFTLITR
ncbi:hypothetical protein [Fictibacillus barbaricus]|uniref:Uncharacterized protein n=1 Tax=Fictibacillus barbaricus TaxID=182136 RepID=A0ABU1U440_9BACL|nr:hypothetical protein [Fictibacillus barbaricus]MDR7074188.1 hypothetical protein [Fictibacillus barbaricus]